MKQSQRDFVIKELNTSGRISRNYCLNLYQNDIRTNITRLGAIICELIKDGWNIEGKHEKGDFVYYLVKSPMEKIVYTIPGMEDVEGKLKQLTIFR